MAYTQQIAMNSYFAHGMSNQTFYVMQCCSEPPLINDPLQLLIYILHLNCQFHLVYTCMSLLSSDGWFDQGQNYPSSTGLLEGSNTELATMHY